MGWGLQGGSICWVCVGFLIEHEAFLLSSSFETSETKSKQCPRRATTRCEGDHKGSPLPWTNGPGKRLRSHSRGDPLWLTRVGFLGADRHIRRGGGGWEEGRGRLRRPWGEGQRDWATGRGRRTTQGVPSPRHRPFRCRFFIPCPRSLLQQAEQADAAKVRQAS
jgi:hypothetical protein